MSEWISVKDKYPAPEQWVLAYGNHHHHDGKYKSAVCLYDYCLKDGFATHYFELLTSGCTCCDDYLKEVTHWMPLPEKPND